MSSQFKFTIRDHLHPTSSLPNLHITYRDTSHDTNKELAFYMKQYDDLDWRWPLVRGGVVDLARIFYSLPRQTQCLCRWETFEYDRRKQSAIIAIKV